LPLPAFARVTDIGCNGLRTQSRKFVAWGTADCSGALPGLFEKPRQPASRIEGVAAAARAALAQQLGAWLDPLAMKHAILWVDAEARACAVPKPSGS